MRTPFALAILVIATAAWAQQPMTGTVVSPAPGQPGSLQATRVNGIDDDSCTAKGFLYIAVTGTDQQNSEAIVAKFQLVDPEGRRIGPKLDSEEIISELPTGSGFSWEALDDDEDLDAPPEVPHGVFEICNPLNGTYQMEGKALVTGSYTIENRGLLPGDTGRSRHPAIHFIARRFRFQGLSRRASRGALSV